MKKVITLAWQYCFNCAVPQQIFSSQVRASGSDVQRLSMNKKVMGGLNNRT